MLIITDMPICFPDATCYQHNMQTSLLSIQGMKQVPILTHLATLVNK